MPYWRLSRRLVSGAFIAAFGLLGPTLTAGRVTRAASTAKAADQAKAEKAPKLVLRATPLISYAPSRISLFADLEGGANDYEAYYCPTVEWQWGDGTTSEASSDCDPYQPGKSQIERFYSVRHTYVYAGQYRIFIVLKKNGKVVGRAGSQVLIRPGLGNG